MRPRVATRQFTIDLALDMFAVQGELHRRATDSSNLVAYLSQADRAFLPLTEVHVRSLPNPQVDQTLPVALVSTQQIRFWSLVL